MYESPVTTGQTYFMYCSINLYNKIQCSYLDLNLLSIKVTIVFKINFIWIFQTGEYI